jgi:hypothetical protein
MRVLGVANPDKYVAAPQPQGPQGPSPQDIAARAKLIDAQTKQQTEPAKVQQKALETAMRGQQINQEQNVADTNLAKEMVIHQNDRRDADRDYALRAADHGLKRQQFGLDAATAEHQAALGVAELNNQEPAGGT